MKTKFIFSALALGLAVVACNNQTATTEGDATVPEVKTAKDYLPSKADVDSVSYLLGINFGSFIKGYDFGTDLNYNELMKGMKEFINAEGEMRTDGFEEQFKINPNEMNRIFNTYLENRRNYTSLVNKEAEEKFLASNAKKSGVQVTESGLQYEIVEAGNDVKASLKDTVWVKYKGTLTDGTVFDETPQEGEPVSFTLDQVISGWQEGIQLIGEGGKVKLYVPSALGYGERGTQGIPGYSTLIFDVELSKVGKVAAE